MDTSRRSLCGAAALMLAGCAASGPALQAARSGLAPTGKLRAAINFNNPVLAMRGPGGDAQGVSVDLAREAARRLGVPIELVPFTGAGLVVDALRDGKVDVGFVAIDPVRGVDVDYTAPYVIIEGSYLVRADSQLRANDEVDRPGTRIVVGRGSAYDLFLTREIKRATVVRIEGSPRVVDEFLAQKSDVAAGVKQQLEADAKRVGGVRLLPGRFMVIEQAMGVPKGRVAAQQWLSAYIEEMKASGVVADALARHRIDGAAVAPAPPARTTRVRGTIESVAGANIVVRTRAGESVTLALAPDLAVTEVYPVPLAEVRAGTFVGVGGIPQADGAQRAHRGAAVSRVAARQQRGALPFRLLAREHDDECHRR